MKTIVALFDTFSDAQAAVRELEASGFSHENVSVIAQKDVLEENGEKTATAAGAAIGAGLGLLAGLAAVTVPGVGILLAVGPILAGGVLGAVAGGLIGSLVDSGVPEDEAELYAEGIRRGGTLVTVASDDSRVGQALAILNRHNPVNLSERATVWQASGWTPSTISASPGAVRASVRHAVATETPDVTGQTTMGDEITAAPVPSITATTPAPSAQPTHDTTQPQESSAWTDFERLEPEFRDNFGRSFPGNDYTYDECKPAYQYGCELACDSDATDWDSVEPTARSRWEGGRPGTWDRMKGPARYAFDRVRSARRTPAP